MTICCSCSDKAVDNSSEIAALEKKIDKLTAKIESLSDNVNNLSDDEIEYDYDIHEIYDDTAVIKAYKSGDSSELNDKDLFIYKGLKGAINEIIDEDMSDYEKEKAVSDKLYHKIETYLIQHPNAFQQKNRELLLDFVQQKEGSFRRKELCQTYDISSSQAARLLQRCLELGWVQRERFGVYHFVQDKKGGIKLLQSAADKDFTMAVYQLGRIYYEGDGTDQDYKKAVDYLRKAAERKNYNAKWLLGLCYLNGLGVKQDYYFATQLIADAAPSHQKEFKQLLADDKNGTFTDYLYGLKKYYIEKDYDAAISYFKKVDKAKNVAGKTMLAVCYGNKDYAKRNVKKAFKTLNKVTGSPIADYYLSSMLETGTGTDVDEKRALSLLTNAAENGVAYAQCKLGDKYMEGKGVTKDLSKAAKLYLQAEALGHLTPESAKNLAECYAKKIGILPDLANAEKRIEQLKKHKQNDSLVTMLRTIK